MTIPVWIVKTIYVSIISFVTNCLPPSRKKSRLEPPPPLEILASDSPSPLEFPTTFCGGGGRGYGYFLELHNIV